MSQVMGTLSSLVSSILGHPSSSCRKQIKVWTALQAGGSWTACRSVGQQGRGRQVPSSTGHQSGASVWGRDSRQASLPPPGPQLP